MIKIINVFCIFCSALFLFTCSNSPLVYDASISGKEILTPVSKDVPQINGASVFGVRPDKPVFYHVAVSGKKPITYAAEGLPKGVQIDAATGWITGRSPEKISDYVITLHAENSKGKTTKNFFCV